MIRLPPDFKEFLRLLNSTKIEYLVVGGYAVSYYGSPRATGDLDIWVAVRPETAARLVTVLRDFGFSSKSLSDDLFLEPDRVVRMGVPPLRIEILTSISGVEFTACYQRRTQETIDDVEVSLISLEDLKANKRAANRPRDKDDLDQLP